MLKDIFVCFMHYVGNVCARVSMPKNANVWDRMKHVRIYNKVHMQFCVKISLCTYVYSLDGCDDMRISIYTCL